MNVTVETVGFSLALAAPFETARGTIDTREGVLIAVEDEKKGITGIGEATPLPGWTESLETCKRALEHVGEYTDPQAALASLDGEATPAARHGFETALADRHAREEGTPLYRSLGGTRTVRDVAVNATIGDGSPEEATRAASEAVKRGIECLKVKVGAQGIETDLARLRAIREDSPKATLRADANGAWSRTQAQEALEAFEKEGVDLAYLEQPLDADDLTGHAALSDRSKTPIALDESLASHGIAVLEAGAAEVVICKPMVLGGLDRTRALAARARAAGVEPVVTTTFDGAIARTGAVHLAASLAPIAPCGLATGDVLEVDLVADDPAPTTGGETIVPQTPGTIPQWMIRAALDFAADER
jgi:L-Ala-D/L-Glu epimerase